MANLMDEIPSAPYSKPDTTDLSVAWQFFGNIPDRFKEILAPAFDRVQLAPNERLIRQGELVVTAMPTVLLQLERETLREVMADRPEISNGIIQTLSQRIRERG